MVNLLDTEFCFSGNGLMGVESIIGGTDVDQAGSSALPCSCTVFRVIPLTRGTDIAAYIQPLPKAS